MREEEEEEVMGTAVPLTESVDIELIGNDTTSFCLASPPVVLFATEETACSSCAAALCRTLDMVFEIFTAVPPAAPALTCLD